MIELENVSMTYPGGNQALKNVNINIEKGEFVFIWMLERYSMRTQIS